VYTPRMMLSEADASSNLLSYYDFEHRFLDLKKLLQRYGQICLQDLNTNLCLITLLLNICG
jgi:hypothetical protein